MEPIAKDDFYAIRLENGDGDGKQFPESQALGPIDVDPEISRFLFRSFYDTLYSPKNVCLA